MSPEAFHYYMPAYFVRILENPAETDLAVYGILTCLTIPAIGNLPVPCVGEHATDFFLTFSRRERQAIHSFLRYIVESPFGDDDEFATRLILAVGFWKTLAEL